MTLDNRGIVERQINKNLFIDLNHLKLIPMDNEFANVMSKRTDAELLEVINSSTGDYQPLALEAAKIEFQKRNLSTKQIALANDEIKQKQDLEYAPSNEPLSIAGKIFAFIFPRVLSTLLWKTYTADGQERKYKERVRWQLYGLCFYIAILLIMLIKVHFSK